MRRAWLLAGFDITSRAAFLRSGGWLGGVHHLSHGYKLVALVFVSGDDAVGGLYGVITIGAEGFVGAIVHENDIPSGNLPNGLLLHLACCGALPIETIHGPLHRHVA